MENRNFQIQKDSGEKNRTVAFWKGFGIVCLSIVLAVLTVVVINLNR